MATYRDITFGDTQAAPSVETMAANAANVGGMNVDNFASQLVGDPSAFFTNDMQLSTQTPVINPMEQGTSVDASDARFAMDAGSLATTAATGNVAQAQEIAQPDTVTYDARTSFDRISQPQNQMTAAQGEVRPEAVVEAPQADLQGLATGTNRDGSTSFTGQALNTFASQNISNVIDTSTVSGKLLAQTLGEGNYTDAKATVMGQLDIISKEFVDPDGNPKIPTWAAGVARNVSRIAAFKGMTGTAATAAMSQAIMEATLPIAQQEAKFFQTVTLQNLNNKQQQVINTANVLSKMELTNMDMKLTTAVENAKNFMQMDLTNLSNQQQAAVVNTQARIQSILEDTKAENTARMFEAETINGQNKFYDNLRSTIQTFNAAQMNGMEQFNAGQINDTSQFNSTIENNREQFYRSMQYEIDVANAKWRQSVTMQNAALAFEAAATDVKNLVGISSEAMNQLWDRSDSLLDYAWKTSENSKQLEFEIARTKAEQQLMRDKINAESSGGGFGGFLGTVAGTMLGSFAGGIGAEVGGAAGGAVAGKLFGP